MTECEIFEVKVSPGTDEGPKRDEHCESRNWHRRMISGESIIPISSDVSRLSRGTSREAQSVVKPMGVCPVANDEPGTGMSAPVLGSIRSDETVLLFRLVTNKNAPEGSTATPNGLSIMVNGDPGAGSALRSR